MCVVLCMWTVNTTDVLNSPLLHAILTPSLPRVSSVYPRGKGSLFIALAGYHSHTTSYILLHTETLQLNKKILTLNPDAINMQR